MKRRLLIHMAALAGFAALLPLLAEAQSTGSYEPLAPLPMGVAPASGTNLARYLQNGFRFIIAATAVLSVIMIIIGGFQYVTTDSIYNRSEGKKRIQDAVTGLVLAIVAWLILYTINPNLVEFNLNLRYTSRPGVANAPTGGSGGTGGGGTVTGCTTCTSLSTGSIPTKAGIAGTSVSAGTLAELVTLNSALAAQGITWQVTEAYPPTGYSAADPTGIHSNVCHANGTCVDANFTSGTAPTAANINAFVTAASGAGLLAVYEVSSESARLSLLNQGVPPQNIQVISHITAPHFSVYNR